MRLSRSRSTLVAALFIASTTLAACADDEGGAREPAPNPGASDGRASGNPPERASAVTDTTPYRPGQPDTASTP